MAHDDEAAGGLPAVLHTAKHALEAGLTRALPALRVVNQPNGFDCPGCAWPEANEHGWIEFCENGAKAVAHEATQKRVTREFFLTHTTAALLKQSHRELEAHGRLTQPMIRRPGTERFVPISWKIGRASCRERV